MPFARSQPSGALRLARTNPLLRGMRHSWGTNVAGPGVAYDAVGRANGAFGVGIPSTTSGNQWVAGPNGYYINFDDAGTGTLASVALAIGDPNGSGSPRSNTFSFAARVRFGSLGGALYGSNFGGIEIQISAAGKIELVKQQAVALGGSTGTVSAGVDVDIGVAYDGTTVSYYINGAFAGSSSNAQTFDQSGQQYLGYASNGERLPNGSRIYKFDVWDRALVASEFKAWNNNLWQGFESPAEDDDYLAAVPANITGTLSSTLGPAAMSAAGFLSDSGAFTSILAGASMSASGSVATGTPASGAFSSALGGAAMSASGAATDVGYFASTMAGAAMTATGGVAGVPYGTFASALTGCSMSAAGVVINRGALVALMADASMSATGTAAPHATGAFASTMQGASMFANGYLGNVAPANPVRAYRWRVMRRHFSNPGTQ